MDVGLPFEDISPDQKITILAEAHRYGVEQTGSELSSELAELPTDWLCADCDVRFTIEALLIVDGGPQCPRCRAVGWETVHPGPPESG